MTSIEKQMAGFHNAIAGLHADSAIVNARFDSVEKRLENRPNEANLISPASSALIDICGGATDCAAIIRWR